MPHAAPSRSYALSLTRLFAALALLAGCSTPPPPSADDLTPRDVDPTLFVDAALTSDVTEEPCVLSGGTEATCVRFSVSTVPTDHATGPWCPRTITDDASQGGIWPEGGVAYDVDGSFIANLSTFYGDAAWKMFDDDGSVRVTDTQAACAAAARPDVDEAYTNHCVECQTSYLASDMQVTYVLPKRPVVASRRVTAGNPVGVALNGIGFDPPAPTDAILGAYTLAPFDDCGGHVNLHAGYHYHAATGCGTQVAQPDGHAPMIGYALDGFPFHGQLDEDGQEPADLDACRGHADELRGYHYHVAAPGTNSFVGCFRGEHGCALAGDGAGRTCDATQTGGPPGGGPPGEGPSGRRGPPRSGVQTAHTHAFSTPHEHH